MKTYVDFVRASSNYLSRTSETGLVVHDDLTFGCWVYFDVESTGVETGIISKWNDAGNERGFALYKSASNMITFSISNTGADVFSINNSGVGYDDSQWFYVVGRFTPSTEMALFVNGIWYKTTSGIPATIFQSTEDFMIGRHNGGNYLDGRITQAFICGYAVPDNFICVMYAHTKALYMNPNLFYPYCSSSSTSSSTTTTSSSTTSSSSSSSSSTTTSSSSSSAIP